MERVCKAWPFFLRKLLNVLWTHLLIHFQKHQKSAERCREVPLWTWPQERGALPVWVDVCLGSFVKTKADGNKVGGNFQCLAWMIHSQSTWAVWWLNPASHPLSFYLFCSLWIRNVFHISIKKLFLLNKVLLFPCVMHWICSDIFAGSWNVSALAISGVAYLSSVHWNHFAKFFTEELQQGLPGRECSSWGGQRLQLEWSAESLNLGICPKQRCQAAGGIAIFGPQVYWCLSSSSPPWVVMVSCEVSW